MVFFDSTGSDDLFWSHFEIFHIRKIHYFSLAAPKLVKSLSNHHKSKVHEISDRFSGAELFLTPPEHRDTTFLIFSDAKIPIHYSVKFWLGQIKPSLYERSCFHKEAGEDVFFKCLIYLSKVFENMFLLLKVVLYNL